MTKFSSSKGHYIKSIKSLQAFLAQQGSLANCTLQDLDFRDNGIDWMGIEINNTTFLGCQLRSADELILREKGAFIYPRYPELPYNPYRKALYSWQELMEGHSLTADNSLDFSIHQHFSACRFNPSINEALYQRIHDHAIDEALRTLLRYDAQGQTEKRCIGIMGGHSTLRTDGYYRKVAHTAKLLAEAGFFIVSGGGPGIMEAANLGAWMAGRKHEALEDALQILGEAPHYRDAGYFVAAQHVLAQYPDGRDSLAIPTWYYGHEPSNLFATAIAKYFSNSIREDTLLAVSLHGVVFAPGSAGTTQEIFMEATQNHYGTFNHYSPMVFLGRQRYEVDTMLYPVVRQLSAGQPYHDLLYLADDPEEILRFLLTHGPVRRPS
jgi:predicted Rossmann-fold nucleotide-binding protein